MCAPATYVTMRLAPALVATPMSVTSFIEAVRDHVGVPDVVQIVLGPDGEIFG